MFATHLCFYYNIERSNTITQTVKHLPWFGMHVLQRLFAKSIMFVPGMYQFKSLSNTFIIDLHAVKAEDRETFDLIVLVVFVDNHHYHHHHY